MFSSAFALISAMATFNARLRKLAQAAKRPSRITLPSTFFTESSPSTVRSRFKVMRLLPAERCSCAQAYRRMAYRLRSPMWGGFRAADSSRRFLDSLPNVFEPRTEGQVNFLIFRLSDLHGIHPSGVGRDRLTIPDLLDGQAIIPH